MRESSQSRRSKPLHQSNYTCLAFCRGLIVTLSHPGQYSGAPHFCNTPTRALLRRPTTFACSCFLRILAPRAIPLWKSLSTSSSIAPSPAPRPFGSPPQDPPSPLHNSPSPSPCFALSLGLALTRPCFRPRPHPRHRVRPCFRPPPAPHSPSPSRDLVFALVHPLARYACALATRPPIAIALATRPPLAVAVAIARPHAVFHLPPCRLTKINMGNESGPSAGATRPLPSPKANKIRSDIAIPRADPDTAALAPAAPNMLQNRGDIGRRVDMGTVEGGLRVAQQASRYT